MQHLLNDRVQVSGHLSQHHGKWHINLSWYDSRGNRKRKQYSTGLVVKGNKTEAQLMLSNAKASLLEKLRNNPCWTEILFTDILQDWLQDIRKKVKPTTYSGYEAEVMRKIVPYFEDKDISIVDLTAGDINEFYDDMLETVKGITVQHYHARITSALKWAAKKKYITNFRDITDKIDRPKSEKFKASFLSEAEAIRLFNMVKGHKLELAVYFGAFYGLRRSEIVGLRWKSIDFDGNKITIEHTVTEMYKDGKKVLVAADTTKSKASHRSLPLVPLIKDHLLDLKEQQKAYRKMCGRSYCKKYLNYIYLDPMGERITPQYLTDAFPNFTEKHGFGRIRLHDLRHTCASLLISNKMSLKHVQEWLGHSEFSITANTYAHLETESKWDSANSMKWLEETSIAEREERK